MVLGMLVVVSAIMSTHAAVGGDGGRIQRRVARLRTAAKSSGLKAGMAKELYASSLNQLSLKHADWTLRTERMKRVA